MNERMNGTAVWGVFLGVCLICGAAVLLTAAHITDGIEHELNTIEEDGSGLFD